MNSFIIPIIVIAVFFLFFYLINSKNAAVSFITRLFLVEFFLFFIQFTVALLFERAFKGAIIKFFSQESFAPIWLSFIATIIFIALFCFFIFSILVFLLLSAMSMPKISYCAKIAPVMSVVASAFMFFFSLDIASIIFTATLMLILSPLVFADHDYEVKSHKIETSIDVFETAHDELERLYLQKQDSLNTLKESYRKNIFVRINRDLK